MTRILQVPVAPLFPPSGIVRVMLYGEAPGPLGADKSGIPFWGDRAGKPVYRALESAGLAVVPQAAYADWGGERLKGLGLKPVLTQVALSNAFPSCPTRDGQTFRAPTDAELKSLGNFTRLEQELSEGISRCPHRLRVIAMGRRAAWILQRMGAELDFEFHALPHPSAQGLLQAAPGKGKGLRLVDLQAGWEKKLGELLAV
jgi:uracil-DNA glycosylase